MKIITIILAIILTGCGSMGTHYEYELCKDGTNKSSQCEHRNNNRPFSD
jgi:uncharacterized protein YceK